MLKNKYGNVTCVDDVVEGILRWRRRLLQWENKIIYDLTTLLQQFFAPCELGCELTRDGENFLIFRSQQFFF